MHTCENAGVLAKNVSISRLLSPGNKTFFCSRRINLHEVRGERDCASQVKSMKREPGHRRENENAQASTQQQR